MTLPLRFRPAAIVLLALLTALLTAPPSRAHNAGVHRAMTDRAYEIMVALSKGALETDGDAGLARLSTDAGMAVRKLQNLPAGLPAPHQSRCVDLTAIQKFGPDALNWDLGASGSFESLSLVRIRYPITLEYITGNECGADPDWSPGAFFDAVTTPDATHRRDYTGEILGFWAHQPDDEEDDWHLFAVRPSNAMGITQIKQYIEAAGGAAVGVVWVSVRCAVTCLILLCQTGSGSCIWIPVRRKVPSGGNSSPLGATPARKAPPKGT